VNWRNVWCTSLVSSELDGEAPSMYRRAKTGEQRAPGLYGDGFGGEALVCLLPSDNGDWFVQLVAKVAGCDGGEGCRHATLETAGGRS